jgi:hypothetical protein
MPAVIGAALAVGAVVSTASPVFRGVALAVMLVNYGITARPTFSSWSKGELMNARTELTRQCEDAVATLGRGGRSIVFSDGFEYVKSFYACPPDLRSRFAAVVDSEAAVEFSSGKSDFMDRSLVAIQPHLPLRLERYGQFIASHDSFVLLAHDVPTEWLPAKLLHDGHELKFLGRIGSTRIYQVTVNRP